MSEVLRSLAVLLAIFCYTPAWSAPTTEVSGTFPYSRGWDLKFTLYYEAIDPKCTVRWGFETLPQTETVDLVPERLEGDRYRLKVDLKQLPEGCGWAPAKLNPMLQTGGTHPWLAIEGPRPFPRSPSPINFFCDGTGANHGCSSSSSRERWLCLRGPDCRMGPSPDPPPPVAAGAPVKINFSYEDQRIPGYEN